MDDADGGSVDMRCGGIEDIWGDAVKKPVVITLLDSITEEMLLKYKDFHLNPNVRCPRCEEVGAYEEDGQRYCYVCGYRWWVKQQ